MQLMRSLISCLMHTMLSSVTDNIMRIFLLAMFTILGANLVIDLMDSNIVDVMNERRETIEKQMERM